MLSLMGAGTLNNLPFEATCLIVTIWKEGSLWNTYLIKTKLNL